MSHKRNAKGLRGEQSAEETLRRASEGGSARPNMATPALSDTLAKRRIRKFTYEENSALVRGVVYNKDALYGPLSEMLLRQQKKEIWAHITAAVNDAGSFQRTEEQCKKRLERMMQRLRDMVSVHAKPDWTPWDGLPFSLHLLTDYEAELMITLMMGPAERPEGETLNREQQEEVYEVTPHPHANSAKETMTSASSPTSSCPAAELSVVIHAPVVQATPPPPAADLTPKAPSGIMNKRSTSSGQGQLYHKAKESMLSLIHKDLLAIHQTQIQDYEARLQYYQDQIRHKRIMEGIKRSDVYYNRQQMYLLRRLVQYASPFRRPTSSETAAVEMQTETQAARGSWGDLHVPDRGPPQRVRGRRNL